MRVCQRCKQNKPVAEFRKSTQRSDGLFNWCRQCSTEYQRERRSENRERTIQQDRAYRQRAWSSDPVKTWARVACQSAKIRARRQNVPFNLTWQDIYAMAGQTCPVLNIPLAYERSNGRIQNASPTVDKRKPELGYVPGNICVVSFRANAIKRDASIADLEAVVRFYKSLQ